MLRQNNKHVTAKQQTCYGKTTNMLRQDNKHVTAEQQTCYGRTTNMLRQDNKHVTAEQQTCYGRTTNMLRQCPLATAQQLVYCTTAVSSVAPNRVTNTMSVAPLLRINWGKRSPTFKPSSISLLFISSGLIWWSSTTSLLLISPGPTKVSNLSIRGAAIDPIYTPFSRLPSNRTSLEVAK